MKKIIGRVAILGILSFGIFFTSFNTTSAAAPRCQECVEIQADCNLRCEAGEVGCNWCLKKVDQCFAICKW